MLSILKCLCLQPILLCGCKICSNFLFLVLHLLTVYFKLFHHLIWSPEIQVICQDIFNYCFCQRKLDFGLQYHSLVNYPCQSHAGGTVLISVPYLGAFWRQRKTHPSCLFLLQLLSVFKANPNWTELDDSPIRFSLNLN